MSSEREIRERAEALVRIQERGESAAWPSDLPANLARDILALLARLDAMQEWIDRDSQQAATLARLDALERTLGAADYRCALLERALTLVKRMAVYGPGKGTTPEQTLETIATFVDKRLAAARGDSE